MMYIQVRVPGSDDQRHRAAPDAREQEGDDSVQGPRQEDRRVQGPPGRAAAGAGGGVRAQGRGAGGQRQRHAVQEEGHDQQGARLQPAGGDAQPHHPVPGAEAAAAQLRGICVCVCVYIYIYIYI